MAKKQTAVQWICIEWKKYFDMPSNHFELLVRQALEMEREQIQYAHLTGLIHPLEMEASKQAAQYYDETYGADNSKIS